VSELVLRPGRGEDLDSLTALEEQCFDADAWSAPVLNDELANLVVAEVDGDVVGYATSRVAGDLADLTRVAVHPSHRRTGVGRALVRHVQEVTASGGANRMLLEVSAANEAALKFYAAEGFVEIDRRPRYYRDGSDALVLRLPLGPACGGG
jgi:ribosomal-protein-alanine acetyltransferase